MKINKWPKLFNNKNFLYTKNSLNIYNSGDFITRSFKLSKIINHNLNFKKYIQLTNFIKKITFIKKEDSLLDFGSGNGAFLYFFINKLKHNNLLPMTQTFTSNINETATKSNNDPKDQFANFAEPSKNVINNILNFSKNLEIKRSKFVDMIELVKS
jgi:hypothetical protein